MLWAFCKSVAFTRGAVFAEEAFCLFYALYCLFGIPVSATHESKKIPIFPTVDFQKSPILATVWIVSFQLVFL